jgi:anti-sigma factor RsiW
VNCPRTRQMLDAWLDGELDSATGAEIAGHLAGCASCAALRGARDTLRRRVLEEAPYYVATDTLAESIRRSLGAAADAAPRTQAPGVRERRPTWLQAGVLAGACALLGAVVAGALMAPPQGPAVYEQVIDSHVASLRPGRLIEVASLDRHVVKPWFQGKLDFAPVVRDLAVEGFALQGARLDAVGERPAAAIVYRVRNHPVNLFVWRAGDSRSTALAVSMLRGYGVATWAQDGLQFAAVSDVDAGELERFARLILGPA